MKKKFLVALLCGFACTGKTASAQTNWIAQVAPAISGWDAITYGGGQFVAAAYLGDSTSSVMTSPDGFAWTLQAAPSGSSHGWQAITYGNGVYVAVAPGPGQQVMTSTDGVAWTLQNTPEQNTWSAVTYGNGMFVAVAPDGLAYKQVMSSPDGVNWTLHTSAATNLWNGVAYGNGTFVAVAASGFGNRVMTSPDGITWTIRASASNDAWQDVTFGNGLFVAVSSFGFMTSPDGITWTPRLPGTYNSWHSVAYGNGHFVAVASAGSSGNRVITSPDGINWTPQASTADNTWYAVAYGNGTFAAVSASGPGDRIMISTCNSRSTEVITACDSFSWIDGNTYTASNNTATYTLPNAAGCDSVIKLDLTIPVINTTVSVQDSTVTTTATAGAAYQWFDCGNGNILISGATGQSFTAAVSGHYAVVVTLNGCSDTSICTPVIVIPPVVGIAEPDILSRMTVYPNPANTFVLLEAVPAGSLVTLNDISGRMILSRKTSGTRTKIETSALHNGIYILQVESDKAVVRRKVVVNR